MDSLEDIHDYQFHRTPLPLLWGYCHGAHLPHVRRGALERFSGYSFHNFFLEAQMSDKQEEWLLQQIHELQDQLDLTNARLMIERDRYHKASKALKAIGEKVPDPDPELLKKEEEAYAIVQAYKEVQKSLEVSAQKWKKYRQLRHS